MDHGTFAFFPIGENFESLIVYTPHFFDRYQERFLKDSSLEKSKVMQEFFINNSTAHPVRIGNEKYPDFTFMSSKDGVQLGVTLPSGVLEVRTFLSQEQLKNDQIDIDKNNYNELQKFL
jgi:hypothetical protein